MWGGKPGISCPYPAAFLTQVMSPGHLAMVRGENDNRVCVLSAFFEGIQDSPDMPADVDHAIEIVVDVIMPHIPAFHRDSTIGSVRGGFIVSNSLWLPSQVIEKGRRQDSLPASLNGG